MCVCMYACMYVCVFVCECTGRTVEAKAEHVTDAKQYIKSEGLGHCHSFSGCMGRYTRISAYTTITAYTIICLSQYEPIRVSACQHTCPSAVRV
jgi:hypothetical protein